MNKGKLILILLMSLSCWIQASDPKPIPGCHWKAVPYINASLSVPDGWNYKERKDDGKLIIEIVPAGPNFIEPSKSLYRMTIEKGVKSKNLDSAAKSYVQSVRTKKTTDAQPLDEQTIGKMRLFALVVQYPAEDIEGNQRSIAMAAISNSKTGTLVKVRFDIPADETNKVAPLGNYLYRNSVFDDDY